MKKLFKRIATTALTGALVGIMVFSSTFSSVTAEASAPPLPVLDLSLSPSETLHRGFKIVDGNIHDRYGNLFLVLDGYGRNSNGETLCYHFFITYANDMLSNEVRNSPIARSWTIIHNGSVANVPQQNPAGTVPGRYFGRAFSVVGSNATIWTANSSGFTVNIGIENVTTGQNANWLAGLPSVGIFAPLTVNSTNPNHQFRMRVSGANGSGTAHLHVDASVGSIILR